MIVFDADVPLWARILPNSVSYALVHKNLGFARDPGVEVEKREDFDAANGPLGYLGNWQLLRMPERMGQERAWFWDWNVSPYISSYTLSERYTFSVADAAGSRHQEKYGIGLINVVAFARASLDLHTPVGLFQPALAMGPSFIWWEDSQGYYGRKLHFSWGPLLTYTAFVTQSAFLRLTYEVFSVSQRTPIGREKYRVQAFEMASVGIGYQFGGVQELSDRESKSANSLSEASAKEK